MTEKEPTTLARLKPLVNYFEALVEIYPNPMTQSDLAKQVNRTKTAVNKVKKRLFHFCDKDLLAFESKMILKTDWNTFGSLFVLFLMTQGGSAVRMFLESTYGQEIIQKLYRELCEAEELKKYLGEFGEAEFFFIVRMIGYNLEPWQPQWHPFEQMLKKIDDPELRSDFVKVFVGRELQKIIQNLRPLITTQEDVVYTLRLVKKLTSLSKAVIYELIENLDIIKSLESSKEKDQYRAVYHKTIDFYVEKYVSNWIERIQNEITARGPLEEGIVRSRVNGCS